MHLFFKTKHFCPAIRPARLTAPSCIILATVLSLLFAACNYWGEDWYKNGESGTEVTATQAGGYFSGTYFLTAFETKEERYSVGDWKNVEAFLQTEETAGSEFLIFSGNTVTIASLEKSKGHSITIKHSATYTVDPANLKIIATATSVTATADGKKVGSPEELVNIQKSWGWDTITSYLEPGQELQMEYTADRSEIKSLGEYHGSKGGKEDVWAIYAPCNGPIPAELQ